MTKLKSIAKQLSAAKPPISTLSCRDFTLVNVTNLLKKLLVIFHFFSQITTWRAASGNSESFQLLLSQMTHCEMTRMHGNACHCTQLFACAYPHGKRQCEPLSRHYQHNQCNGTMWLMQAYGAYGFCLCMPVRLCRKSVNSKWHMLSTKEVFQTLPPRRVYSRLFDQYFCLIFF